MNIVKEQQVKLTFVQYKNRTINIFIRRRVKVEMAAKKIWPIFDLQPYSIVMFI